MQVSEVAFVVAGECAASSSSGSGLARPAGSASDAGETAVRSDVCSAHFYMTKSHRMPIVRSHILFTTIAPLLLPAYCDVRLA